MQTGTKTLQIRNSIFVLNSFSFKVGMYLIFYSLFFLISLLFSLVSFFTRFHQQFYDSSFSIKIKLRTPSTLIFLFHHKYLMNLLLTNCYFITLVKFRIRNTLIFFSVGALLVYGFFSYCAAVVGIHSICYIPLNSNDWPEFFFFNKMKKVLLLYVLLQFS